MANFCLNYEDDKLDLPYNDKHKIVRWNKDLNIKILVSFTQKGEDVLSCHYANKGGTFEQSDQAIVDFADFVSIYFKHIKKLCAKVINPEVGKKITNLGWISQGFVKDKNDKKIEIYEIVIK